MAKPRSLLIAGIAAVLSVLLVISIDWTLPTGNQERSSLALPEVIVDESPALLVKPEESGARDETDRRGILDDRLMVRVLDARSGEPVVGATVELRAGDPASTEPPAFYLNQPPPKGLWETLAAKRPNPALISAAYLSRSSATKKTTRTLSSFVSGPGGLADLGMPDAGTYVWAGKDEATGFGLQPEHSRELKIHIEAPLWIRTLDANGQLNPGASVEAGLKVGRRAVLGYRGIRMPNGDLLYRDLWKLLRAELEEDAESPGIFMVIDSEPISEPAFLPIDQEPPSLITLREAPYGALELNIPWLDESLWKHVHVRLTRPRGSTLSTLLAPPYRWEQLALGLTFRLELRMQRRTICEVDLKGPTEPNEDLLLDLPLPDDLGLVQGRLRVLAEGRVQVPENQYALLVTENGAEQRVILDSDGALLCTLPGETNWQANAQVLMTLFGDHYESRMVRLGKSVNGHLQLGELLLETQKPLVSIRVMNEFGESLPQVSLAIQKAIFEGTARRWSVSSSLRVRWEEATGLTELYGSSVFRRLRFRVQNVQGYTDSEWIECSPGAGLIEVMLQRQ